MEKAWPTKGDFANFIHAKASPRKDSLHRTMANIAASHPLQAVAETIKASASGEKRAPPHEPHAERKRGSGRYHCQGLGRLSGRLAYGRRCLFHQQ